MNELSVDLVCVGALASCCHLLLVLTRTVLGGQIPVLVELRPRYELQATSTSNACLRRNIPYSLGELNHFSREMNHRFLGHNHDIFLRLLHVSSHRQPDTVSGEEQIEAFHRTFDVRILLLRTTILCHFLLADFGVILKHWRGSTTLLL